MTAARFLIDLTDERFNTPENAEVLAFIRRVNPFAHSDLGSLLFRLAKALSGAIAYCPLASQCAYVVLHNKANIIFAIAYDQQDLAFRLSAADHALALGSGGSPADAVGRDWVSFNPWLPVRKMQPVDVMEPWAARAFAHTFSSSEPST